MNERIKLLASQLGEPSTWGRERPVGPGFAGSRWSGWSDFQQEFNGYNTPLYDTEQLEKFAELIVRECIGCCEQVISDPVPESVDTWLNGGEQCIQEIKEHFGLGMSVADKKQLIKNLLGVNNDTKS